MAKTLKRPPKKASPAPKEPATPAADEPTPSYRDAIYHLAQVRLRLRSTQLLDDARKKAFDSLTLALVEGSDQ